MLGPKRVRSLVSHSLSLRALARRIRSTRSWATPSSLSLRSQWAWALTLHELLVTQTGRSPKDLVANAAATKLMHNTLMNTSFDGASGKVQFDPATGDRLGLTIVIRNQVDGVEKTIARYQEGAFTPASMDVVWWYNLTSGNKSLSGKGEGVVPRDRGPLAKPSIIDVAPRLASPFGGDTLTILGSNFGATGSMLLITVGGKVCGSPRRLSPSTVSCVTPAGEGADVAVQVNIGGANSAPALVFAYNLVRVHALHPARVLNPACFFHNPCSEMFCLTHAGSAWASTRSLTHSAPHPSFFHFTHSLGYTYALLTRSARSPELGPFLDRGSGTPALRLACRGRISLRGGRTAASGSCRIASLQK